MSPKNSSGCCPDKRSTSGRKKSAVKGIAPVRIDMTSLCSGCQSQPLTGGCLRSRCKNCDKGTPRGLALCKRCSGELGQCRRCRKALPQAKPETTCGSCLKTPLPTNAGAGKCAACQGFTSSKAVKLCSGCSGKLGRCDRCRKPLPGAKSATATPHSARRRR